MQKRKFISIDRRTLSPFFTLMRLSANDKRLKIYLIKGKNEIYFWIKYDLRQKYYAPQVRPDRGLNSLPPDHDSTFHVIETPVLIMITWLSVTRKEETK